jgi:hypothetical protein
MSMMLPLGLGVFQNLANLWMTERNNEQRERLAREAMGVVQGSRQSFDPSTYLQGLPGVTMGGQSFGGRGGINLDSFYGPQASVADAFSGGLRDFDWGGLGGTVSDRMGAGRGELVDSFDYGGLADRIGDIFGGGVGALASERYDPSRAAGDVGGFYRDEPLDAYLANELSRIGESSRVNAADARTQLVSQGLASGRNLQEMSGDLAGLDFSAGLARSREATGARAAQEAMRVQRADQRSADMATTYRDQAGINQSLVQAAAELARSLGLETGRIGSEEAGHGVTLAQDRARMFGDEAGILTGLGQSEAADRLAIARALGEGTAFDVGQEGERREDLLDRFASMFLAPQLEANAAAAGNRFAADQMAASILAGYAPSLGQFDFGDVISGMYGVHAARKSRPKSNPFSFGISI